MPKRPLPPVIDRLRRVAYALTRPFRGSSPGAGLVEYLIILGCVALLAMGGWTRYGQVIRASLKVEAIRIEGKGLPTARDLLGDFPDVEDGGPVCQIGGLCTPGSGFCFGKGTLVATATGDRPIETIQVGDLVWARDIRTGADSLRPVLRTFVTPNVPVMDLVLASSAKGGLLSSAASEHLVVTPDHHFWVEDAGWVRAEELGEGLLGAFAGYVNALPLGTLARAETVYNFEVDEYHSYFVGRAHALVHNADGDDNGPCPPGNPSFQAMDGALRAAGFDASDIADIEGKIARLPAAERDKARERIAAAVRHITSIVPDFGKRKEAIDAVTDAATNPKIEGFDDWLDYAKNRRTAADLQSEIDALKVAKNKADSVGDGKVEIGIEQHAQGRSFDLQVKDGSGNVVNNVEIYSPRTPLRSEHLHTGLSHAADKVKPTTTGAVEAAVVINQPLPPNTDQIFDDFLTDLNTPPNNPDGLIPPIGADKVDTLVVYDRDGNVIRKYEKVKDPTTGMPILDPNTGAPIWR